MKAAFDITEMMIIIGGERDANSSSRFEMRKLENDLLLECISTANQNVNTIKN